MAQTKKSLGQHWLRDRETLSYIAECAQLQPTDTVLEIGPGQGSLTSELLRRAGQVVAVELDGELAKKLPGQFPGKNLTVLHQDILQFDLSTLPSSYKVVANVPYYITSKIIQLLMTVQNKPSQIVLLVQKEVAERVAAAPGNMSILAVSVQVYGRVSLGQAVPAQLFLPPPKVDSQVLIIQPRLTISPFKNNLEEQRFFRMLRAGFSAKRKKLRSSLAGGLGVSKQQAETWLDQANISANERAEMLTLEDWHQLAKIIEKARLSD